MKKLLNFNRYIFLLLSLSLIPVLYSGCKSKYKLVKTSKSVDQSKLLVKDSVRVILTEKSNLVKIDSTKKVNTEKETTNESKSITFSFKLDSNKKVIPLDTNQNLNINSLINAALQSATQLIIKVEDQQSKTNDKSNSSSDHKSEISNKSLSKDSTAGKSLMQNNNIVQTNKEEEKKKDASVATTVGGRWILLIIVLIFVVVFLIWRFKR